MPRTKNTGVCLICNQNLGKIAIKNHIDTCINKSILTESKNTPPKPESIYLLEVNGFKPFWLIFEVRGTTTLDLIDQFLRDIWLECCGHLSQFKINGISYSSYPNSDLDDENMSVLAKDVLNEETEFDYEYDFGDTTELKGKVLKIRKGFLDKPIRLLAQNNIPENICQNCDSKAGNTCAYCYEPVCEQCQQNHECGEGDDNFLPIVNSPRSGCCGYTGPENDLDRYYPNNN